MSKIWVVYAIEVYTPSKISYLKDLKRGLKYMLLRALMFHGKQLLPETKFVEAYSKNYFKIYFAKDMENLWNDLQQRLQFRNKLREADLGKGFKTHNLKVIKSEEAPLSIMQSETYKGVKVDFSIDPHDKYVDAVITLSGNDKRWFHYATKEIAFNNVKNFIDFNVNKSLIVKIADEIARMSQGSRPWKYTINQTADRYTIDFDEGAPDYGGSGLIDEFQAENEFQELKDKVLAIIKKHNVIPLSMHPQEKEMWTLVVGVK